MIKKRKKVKAEEEGKLSAMLIRPMHDSEEDLAEQDSEDEAYVEMNRIFDNNSPSGFTSVFNQGQTTTPFTAEFQHSATNNGNFKSAKMQRLRIQTDENGTNKQDSDNNNNNNSNGNVVRPQTYPFQNFNTNT